MEVKAADDDHIPMVLPETEMQPIFGSVVV
jgi:hypothetical protein